MLRKLTPIVIVLIATGPLMRSADAQITVPTKLSAVPDRTATLEDRLTNRLRATSDQQKAYIKFVVKQIRDEKLDTKLVVAIEQKAIARNRYFPFPFFERAMRYEAAKRNVILPPIQRFATTKIIPTY